MYRKYVHSCFCVGYKLVKYKCRRNLQVSGNAKINKVELLEREMIKLITEVPDRKLRSDMKWLRQTYYKETNKMKKK